MAAPAITATTSLAVVALGAAANIVASNKPLCIKSWDKRGGFIGLVTGRTPSRAATSTPDSPMPSPTQTESPSAPKGAPIGGATDLPAPPTPFGRFRKHKPTKLPGPPKPYDPKSSP